MTNVIIILSAFAFMASIQWVLYMAGTRHTAKPYTQHERIEMTRTRLTFGLLFLGVLLTAVVGLLFIKEPHTMGFLYTLLFIQVAMHVLAYMVVSKNGATSFKTMFPRGSIVYSISVLFIFPPVATIAQTLN